MSEALEKVEGKGRKQRRWARIVVALLLVYALSTGPMTYVVAKLNGGNHTVGWPLRIIVLPYQSFYRALDHAPKPMFRAWENYDTFFWDLATKP